MFVVRDGEVVVKAPKHAPGDTVSEDMMILLGVAASFHNPKFRNYALTAVQQAMERGDLDGIVAPMTRQ